ncbi:HesB/IscA family protein [Candidatus Neoehrlichia procyonis]|uniref:Iron-sulfur cluster assembly accessory family protein n=1 Tax=Candidatus Neoehrlichia procyonis str. RAC413 TaxID=1359163 RepID=A0A0F3NM99_9RICK|nr:iron-sulfur cluster assembly accessory protein [Candidatus Neoehrlichia lotoris]KJV68906.1 iron-sulfur cluster assembly accessory family protein [Candidatus Neoehrlichia lotoris str. RAC413]
MSNLKNNSLTLTDNAINKIKSLIHQENSSSIFKVSVEGGGCSGFQYKFSINNNFSDDDIEEEDDDEYYDEDENEDEFDELDGGSSSKSNVVISDNYGNPLVLIDNHSNKFLKNATIDYVEDINGSGFIVNNPNTKSKCGCGNSFSI